MADVKSKVRPPPPTLPINLAPAIPTLPLAFPLTFHLTESLRGIGYPLSTFLPTISDLTTIGNTSDQDSDREPEPPVKTVDKVAARSGKRDTPKPAPAEPANTTGSRGGRTGPRRGAFSGNDEGMTTT